MRSADSLCPIRIIFFLFLLQLRTSSLTLSLSLHQSLSATLHCLSYRLPRRFGFRLSCTDLGQTVCRSSGGLVSFGIDSLHAAECYSLYLYNCQQQNTL
jgi:hypothetical protein